MPVDAYGFLKSSLRAVPAMRYAMAVGGVIALLAIVKAWGVSPAYAGLGFLAVMVAMVVFVIFGMLAKASGPGLRPVVIVLAWFCLLAFVFAVSLSLACVFFDYPKRLPDLLDPGASKDKAVARVSWDGYWARAERLRGDYSEGLGKNEQLELVRKQGLALAQDLEVHGNWTLSRSEHFYRAYLIGVGYLYSALSSYATSASPAIYGDYAQKSRQALEEAARRLADIEATIQKLSKTGGVDVAPYAAFTKWVNDYQAHEEMHYAFGLSLLLRQRIGDPVLPQIAEQFGKIPEGFLRTKSPRKESIINWHCAQPNAVKALCGRAA